MNALYSDTDPKAEAIQIELLRHTPAWRKIQMVAQLNEMVRTLALSRLHHRHPDASPEELCRPLAEKVYGPKTGVTE